jgi:hypothetical protein
MAVVGTGSGDDADAAGWLGVGHGWRFRETLENPVAVRAGARLGLECIPEPGR